MLKLELIRDFYISRILWRDVISGMLILHVFHKHNDRVKMANIAQMVNVLQAMILTDGEKMVLTPTYHLFRMMKGHMDGERVDVDYDCEEQEINGLKFPKISISASKKNGEMTVSICNTSLNSDEDMELDLRDGEFSVADRRNSCIGAYERLQHI